MSKLMAQPPRFTGLRWYPYYCPVCGDDEYPARPCLCDGEGVITAEQASGWAEHELVPVPRPAAVRKGPCLDCAVRRGSPEHEQDPDLRHVLRPDGPFWCHQGTADVRGEHVYTLRMNNGAPIGAELCAGWFDWMTTGALPEEPYQELEDTRERVRAARRRRFAAIRERMALELDPRAEDDVDGHEASQVATDGLGAVDSVPQYRSPELPADGDVEPRPSSAPGEDGS